MYPAVQLCRYAWPREWGRVPIRASGIVWEPLASIRSICGYAAEEAVLLTIGGRLAPAPEMLVQSKLILIWGSNPASTAPHLMPFLASGAAQRHARYRH